MYFKLYPSDTYTTIATGWKGNDPSMHTLFIRKNHNKTYEMYSTLPCIGCNLTLAQAKKYIKRFLEVCCVDSIDYSNMPYTIIDYTGVPGMQYETKREANNKLWHLNNGVRRDLKFGVTQQYTWNTKKN